MSALTRDRNTPLMNATVIAVLVASNAKIFAGALVVANANGYAAPGSTAVGLTYLGRAEESVDNTGGADGAATVPVRRLSAFKWGNDGSITQAHQGKTAYIVDDQTLAATDGTGTRSAAGRIVGIESDGVWIE
uniref:Putative structural protein n=1 Tax=viral metagenome TaxID=1070528 RepID=A0A6H1ZE98_9ZZZZ